MNQKRPYISLFSLLLQYVFGILKPTRLISLTIPGLQTPLKIRKWSSDIYVVLQVFVFREYDTTYVDEPRFILDAGANIGCSVLYFLALFPNATIVAIEPDLGNIEVLKENTSMYPNVTWMKAALWPVDEALSFSDNKKYDYGLKNHWGIMVEKGGDEASVKVDGISVSSIMTQSNVSLIDIAKIDIEGAEKELFLHPDTSWIDHTRMLIIEHHDRMKEGCSEAVFSVMKPLAFSQQTKGENVIFLNQSL